MPANDCVLSETTKLAGDIMYKITYHYFLPMYLILGGATNIILLIAFYRKSKTQQAYVYQVLLTGSKTLEIFVFGTFLLELFWWSGIFVDKADWFVRSYAWMFHMSRIGLPGCMLFIISSPLLAVAMSADRVFALTRPFVYKNIHHKKHQITATCVCFLVSVSIAMAWIWFFKIVPEDDHYIGATDQDYVSTWYPQLASKLEVAVRLICAFGLIGLNLIMIKKFVKQKSKIATSSNDKKELERKAAERMIILLNLYQSILMNLNQLPHTLLHLSIFISSDFDACYGSITHPLADGCIMITDTFDLFIIMAINKKIRNMVFHVFRCDGHGPTQIQSQTVRTTAASAMGPEPV